MGEFFTAGEHYENRLGEYEVLEVKTPMLLIRYAATGRLQEVEQELQERIVRNLRREQAIASKAVEERNKPVEAKGPARRKRARFPGFADTDFAGKIQGTSWRSKTGLGGVVAEQLTDVTGDTFDSWAPNRQTAVYIASPDLCGAEHLHDSAQYFIMTTPTDVTYGLMVQRPADSVEGATAWDRLIGALSDDEVSAAKLEDLLTNGNAELTWCVENWGPNERETVRGDVGGLTIDRGAVSESGSLEGLVERLNEAPQDQNLVLTIEAGLSAGDAITAGGGIAETVSEFMVQLIGLYRACSG